MTEAYSSYDYAWDTPGWTVQNPSFPLAEGYVVPGMPEVSLVNVVGTFKEFGSGQGLEGVLRLRVPTTLTHGPTGAVIPAGDIRPVRFKHGILSIWLPATDDPDLTPPFEYEARLTVRGQRTEFTFALPALVPEVNINDLMGAV